MLIDLAEVDKVGAGDNSDCKDETVRKLPSKNLNRATVYLTPDARQAFTQLRQTFTKAPILWHFDPKCHIRIETNVLGYAIGGVLSQLTFDNLDQWHPVAYYSQKITLAKTCYKTHNGELLTIIKTFKIWPYYLENCKHEVLVLTDYNNLYRFIDIKNLSFRQIH